METKVLNQAVKRNIDRFPPEFMFQLTKEEYEALGAQNMASRLRSQFVTSNVLSQNGLPILKSQIVTSSLRSQFATSKESWGGRRKLPYAFTEHGVIMLSSVLNNKIATQLNIAVVKAFIEMRRYIAKPVRKKLNDLEKVLMLHIDDTNHNFAEHAETINKIITSLNNLIETPPKPKRRIGFNAD